MLSSVLPSTRAARVNVEIVRAFVRLRRFALSHASLEAKIAELEHRYDAQFKAVFDAIRELMAPEKVERRPIEFRALAAERKSTHQRSGARRLRSTKARMRSRAAAPVRSAAP